MNQQVRFIEKIASANGTDQIGFLVAEAREVLAAAEDGQELSEFRQTVADALAALRVELNAEAAYCSEDDSDYDEGVQFALTHLDATITALKLPAPTKHP